MERPLRILMIHNRYQATGGEDASTDAQVALLRNAGHQVLLAEDTNERIDELGTARTAARSVWSIEAHRRVEKLVADHRFDVMHVQNYFPLFSPSIYYAAAKKGVPVVQSLRNFRAICPEGMLHRDGNVCTDCIGRSFAFPAVANKCYRNSAAGSGVVAIMSATHRAMGTWKKRVTRYVTPSEHARDVYVRAGWDREQIDVIPNFVFPDPGVGEGQGGYAIYAGRLAPPKGLEVLIQAWQLGNLKVPLKIVGEGPLKHYVKVAARSNEQIEYLGEVDPATASELIGDAMFAIVPTRGIETFGRVAAEAMAKGTPSIVAGHGGLSEIIDDGISGVVMPPGDVESLIKHVRFLTEDPGRLAEMRLAARERFEAKFSGERVLDSWVRLYREVADSG